MTEIEVVFGSVKQAFSVFGFEYRGPDAKDRAGVLFKRVQKTVRHASVWRTTTHDRKVWRIVVIAEPQSNARGFDYGDGTPIELTDDEIAPLLERKLASAIDAFLQGRVRQSESIHFGRGAILRRGGVFELTIGGDQ